MMIPEKDLSRLPWRKSTLSGSGQTCVEVAPIVIERAPADDK